MATGSTWDFEENRDQIIGDALANLNAVAVNGTPTNAQVAHAARALNRVVKNIDPAGNFLWRVVRRTFSTTSGTATYGSSGAVIATDVIAIDEPMRFTRSGSSSSSVITPIARDEYMALANRATEARDPFHYFVERTLTQPTTLILYPVPNTSSDTVEYAAVLRSLDFDTGANTPDFFPEWTSCLVDGLTAELAPAYGKPDLVALFMKKFTESAQELINAGDEHGNTIFVPFGWTSHYGGDE